ncbi:MAG: phosphoribosylglycinamide formyltransferase [Vicinamibacteria bacterium]|nr:phosphoribosylglycinamide formyltransferase [Vicinamibacteria bacterium]
MKRIGVLISGRGSNLQALIDAQRAGELGGGEIVIVVSNVETAPGIERARQAGIPAVFRDHRGRKREEYDAEIVSLLKARDVGVVCLAGFMRLLSPVFVSAFPNRILNVHPALLPAFAGLDAQQQAFAHGVKVSGATVHIVDENLDSGTIVAQEAVPVFDTDDVETLTQRILASEHRIYPKAVRILLSDRYRIEGRRFIIGDGAA